MADGIDGREILETIARSFDQLGKRD